MKPGMLLAAALLCVMSAGNLQAQPAPVSNRAESHHALLPDRIEKTKDCYLMCLDSHNDGIVESGIAYALQMKLLKPDAGYSAIERKLRDLAANGATPAIRYKAQIAVLVYDDQSLVDASAADCNDCDAIFQSVASSVQRALIGYSAR